MIRYGRLCGECGTTCREIEHGATSDIECPECGGRGCEECREGRWDIPGCPYTCVTPETWEALELASHADHGLPPVSGGALDQSAWFLAAWEFIRGEERYWKRVLRVDG